MLRRDEASVSALHLLCPYLLSTLAQEGSLLLNRSFQERGPRMPRGKSLCENLVRRIWQLTQSRKDAKAAKLFAALASLRLCVNPERRGVNHETAGQFLDSACLSRGVDPFFLHSLQARGILSQRQRRQPNDKVDYSRLASRSSVALLRYGWNPLPQSMPVTSIRKRSPST